jgi:hypothetical protein
MSEISNRQRALWMVLITALAAPFFAGLSVVAIALAAKLAGVAAGPGPEQALGATG